jgi:glycosyltransferase involved in cell wall biosynthesis
MAEYRSKQVAQGSLMNFQSSVSVVIPTYNMGWCISRAIRSCQSQSLPVDEIIVVDDCSTDETEDIVRQLADLDQRIIYLCQPKNTGSLAALAAGIRRANSNWAALLDADDELTPISVETRIRMAVEYHQASGQRPQLIYGDLRCEPLGIVFNFARLRGYSYCFVSKELCLCQTSTMMIGRDAFSSFPRSERTMNTDDIIALAISKEFPILHSGEIVAVYHAHSSSKSGDPRRCFFGVVQLVYDYQRELLRTRGFGRLALWYCRILKALFTYQLAVVNERLPSSGAGVYCESLSLQGYRIVLLGSIKALNALLRRYFELDYF